jgi:hypothetical protein
MEKAMSEDLKKQAEELGIKVDGRWSDERLQQEIDNSLATPTQAAHRAEQVVAVMIKRDTWDGDGNRHRKGTIVEMPVEEAMDAIEAGSVSRVKG